MLPGYCMGCGLTRVEANAAFTDGRRVRKLSTKFWRQNLNKGADVWGRCVGTCHLAGWDADRAAREAFFAS